MGHIKIQDLSIGDWVIYNEKYYQILNIGTMTYEAGVGLLFRHYCTLTRGMDIQDDIDINEISPIPITPEILEKNGFVLTGYAIQHNEKNRYADEDTLIVMSKNEWYCTVNQGFLRDISMYANSVHELQHIWRLAKIDKEITL